MADKIKFCVWDVGNVIYNYSLKPLDEWFCEHTRSPEKYLSGRGVFGFDYNDYMKGLISDNGFCQRLCETFDVDFNKESEIAINKALHKGVGRPIKQTQKILKTVFFPMPCRCWQIRLRSRNRISLFLLNWGC